MIRIGRVDVEVYCHATEDEGKVRAALEKLLPRGARFIEEKYMYEGYYGNPIRIIRIRLSGADAEKFVRQLARLLSGAEKSVLRASFALRYEERGKRLHIRLDKQRLYGGEAIVSDGNDVVKITIHLSGRGNVEDFLHEIGLI